MSKKITDLDVASSPQLTWYTIISDSSGNAKKISLTDLKALIGIPLQQLSTPSVSSTTISSNQINLSWGVVYNASSYYLQRSTDNATWTQIGGTISSAATTYSDTGLSSLTAYYYRLKAVGNNVIYSDSEYASTSGVTYPTENYATWYDILNTQYEQYNSNKGVRRMSSPNLSSSNTVYTIETISEGYGFEFSIDNVANNVFQSWLAQDRTQIRTDSLYQLALNSNYSSAVLNNSSVAQLPYSAITAVVGDRIMISYKNSKINMCLSKDSGSTYSLLYSFNTVPTSSYYWAFGNNQLGYGSSEVKYRQALTIPPYLFKALALSGNTAVSMSWQPVTSASLYTVQRATNSTFSTNLTTIYTGSALSYADTGLSNNTTYYYRIKALAGAETMWTAYSTTTSAAGELSYLTWNNSGSRNEYTSDYKGIRRMVGYNSADANYSYSNETISNGEGFVYTVDDVASSIYSVAINTTKTVDPGGNTNFLRVFLNSNISVYEGASLVSSGNTIAAGNYVRIAITTGSLRVQKSTDSGSNWTNMYTSSLSPTSSYYFGYASSFSSGYPLSKTYKMTGL